MFQISTMSSTRAHAHAHAGAHAHAHAHCAYDVSHWLNNCKNIAGSLPKCPRLASAQLIRTILASRNRDGVITTPIYAACVMGRADMIVALMDMVPHVMGAGTGQINEPSGRGFLPLHGAAQHGSINCVEVLVALNARMNHCASPDNICPLQMAAREGNLVMVRLQVEHGAHVNNADCGWNTPLYAAALASPSFNKAPDFMGVVRFLLDSGAHADPQVKNNTHNSTPLSLAIMRDDNDMMCLFLDRGADVQLAVAGLKERDRRRLRACIARQRDAAKKEVAVLAKAIGKVDLLMATMKADDAANNLIASEESERYAAEFKAQKRASKNERERMKRQLRREQEDAKERLTEERLLQKAKDKEDLQVEKRLVRQLAAQERKQLLKKDDGKNSIKVDQGSKPLPASQTSCETCPGPCTQGAGTMEGANSDTDDEDSECVVCFDALRDTLMLPCGHVLMCGGCMDALLKHAASLASPACCPFCREPVADTLLLT